MGTHQLLTSYPGSHTTAIRNLTPQPVDLTPMPQLLPYMQSFFSFGQHVIYQALQSLTYIYTTNRQQNTQTRYMRWGETRNK